ncbi:MAG: hypothetical protein U0M02_02200 [Acutalibacteraceae bacterium]|nr:hypothetical protein [Acutalibacteraceae bacterium]
MIISDNNTKTCRDCLSKELCDLYTAEGLADIPPGDELPCKMFIDKALYIKIPFEVGEYVYTIGDEDDLELLYISREKVTDISTKGVWISAFDPAQDDCSFLVLWEDFGKEFFLTPDEAMKALEALAKR